MRAEAWTASPWSRTRRTSSGFRLSRGTTIHTAGPRRGPARIAGDRRRHDPDLRADLRDGERRRRKRGTIADPKRFAFINELSARGCGGLLGRVELPQRRADGDAVRAQAQDQPVDLQHGLVLPERVLPELRHRGGRDPPAPHPAAPRRLPPGRRLPLPDVPGPRRAVRPPDHRGRRAASSRSGRWSPWPPISRARG